MYLNALPKGCRAVIDHLVARGPSDAITARLTELGFVDGESVQVIAHGPLGADPIAVRIGSTRFALRREEASRVCLRDAH